MATIPIAGNTPVACGALKYGFALGSAPAHVIAADVIWRFPLNQTGHAAIRRAFDERAVTTPQPTA